MTRIEPALTPEEWARGNNAHLERMEEGRGGLYWYRRAEHEPEPLYFPTRHGSAALNLHGQPFGFTHADVDLIRYASSLVEDTESTGDIRADLKMSVEIRDRLLGSEPEAPQAGGGVPVGHGGVFGTASDRLEGIRATLDAADSALSRVLSQL